MSYGSGGISGAPSHITLSTLDDHSIGSQDNQINDILLRACVTGSAEVGNVLCKGGNTGSITITVEGGVAPFTYKLDNGTPQSSNIFNNLLAGSYSIKIEDANGCQETIQAIINEPALILAAVSAAGSIACNGGTTSVMVSASGGTAQYGYSLNGGNSQTSAVFNNLAPGNYTIIVKDANNCKISVFATIEDGPVCYPHYTYTQGYYGNSGGKSCIREDGLQSTFQIIKKSLNNGGPMVLGRAIVNKTFTATNSDNDVNKIISLLPSGGLGIILAGNYNLTTALPPTQNNKIRNVFLGQTITLWLNTHIPGNDAMGLIDLLGANNKNYIVTINIDGSAPCTAPFRATCSNNANAINSYLFPQQVVNALIARNQGTSINALLNFASDALGGGSLYGASLPTVTAAVDAINKAFDGGKYFEKFSATAVSCSSSLIANTNIIARGVTPLESITNTEEVVTDLKLTAYPNPFSESINFSFVSPVAGKAALQILNIDGKVLATVFEGLISAGVKNNVRFNKLNNQNGLMLYRLNVGNKVTVGKITAL